LFSVNSTGLPARAQHVHDVLVRRGQSLARIDDEQYAVGLFNGLERLLRHESLDASLGLDQPAGVDHHGRTGSDVQVAVLTVAREPRNVGDERIARSRQRVEQRRLPDVGPADERDDGKHGQPPFAPPMR
jgi:hypothetical protein